MIKKPIKKIALLVGKTDTLVDDNYLRFANYLLSRSCEPSLVLVDTLCMVQNQVYADAHQVVSRLQPNEPFPSAFSQAPLNDFDLCWLLSLGYRGNFLDKIQLLHNLPNPLINSLDAIMYLKSKYFLASKTDLIRYPDSWASTDPDYLYGITKREGGRWIAKPPAGSLGKDVFLLEENDPNIPLILETLTGDQHERYCLLQRYVEEINSGEKRVLLANGKPLAQYMRTAVSDHRTNLMQGAKAEPCGLSPEEERYCEQIGSFLRSKGAYFVGLDLVYPWVIEVNVVNPGGILTIEQLEGGDLTPRVIDSIVEGLQTA